QHALGVGAGQGGLDLRSGSESLGRHGILLMAVVGSWSLARRFALRYSRTRRAHNRADYVPKKICTGSMGVSRSRTDSAAPAKEAPPGDAAGSTTGAASRRAGASWGSA